jgi:hypothetical protein
MEPLSFASVPVQEKQLTAKLIFITYLEVAPDPSITSVRRISPPTNSTQSVRF